MEIIINKEVPEQPHIYNNCFLVLYVINLQSGTHIIYSAGWLGNSLNVDERFGFVWVIIHYNVLLFAHLKCKSLDSTSRLVEDENDKISYLSP